MTVCRFADLTVGFLHRYPYFSHFVREYTVTDAEPELEIAVTDEEILAEAATAGNGATAPAPLEAIALWRKFCHTLPGYGAFLLHAACLAVNGRGIMFSAPSGTGKSTHAAHWCSLLGKRCTVINGDKPILRRDGNRFLGYGTPFCGKEDQQENSSVPIHALFFLERGDEDRVLPLTPSEAFPLLFSAALAPKDSEELSLLLPLISELLFGISLYRIICTPRPEAAQLAIKTVLSEDLL